MSRTTDRPVALTDDALPALAPELEAVAQRLTAAVSELGRVTDALRRAVHETSQRADRLEEIVIRREAAR